MRTYTEETGELNSVPFSAIHCQCDTRPVPQTTISQAVSHNSSPLLDTLRSNTENTGTLPSVTGASVSCGVNIQATLFNVPRTTHCSQDQLHGAPLPVLFSSASKTAWTSPQCLLGLVPGLAQLLCSGIVRGELE